MYEGHHKRLWHAAGLRMRRDKYMGMGSGNTIDELGQSCACTTKLCLHPWLLFSLLCSAQLWYLWPND